MAPKEQEDEIADTANEEVEAVKEEKLLWLYGVNEHITDLDDAVVKSFQATGNLHADFAAFCKQHKVAGHPVLMPTASEVKPNPNDASDQNEEEGDAQKPSGPPTLALQAAMLDLLSLKVLKVVMPSALHLETVRISGCHLDAAMLAALRTCFTGNSTVTTLHLDWNPLEMPYDQESLQALAEAYRIEDVQLLEQKREQGQADRVLQAFKEQLEVKRKDVSEAIAAVAEASAPRFPSTAMMEPLSIERWMGAFSDSLGLSCEDSGRVFHVLDKPEYGPADGYLSLEFLQTILGELAPPEDDTGGSKPPASATPPPVFPDIIGSTFAAFVEPSCTLEMVSLRCCNICRLETKAIASVLATSSHLRALNLWGNRVCDRGAEYLSTALEYNFGLLFLGLGKNLITHVGLEMLCKPLGHTLVQEKAEADKLMKAIKDQEKELEKQKKAAPAPPKDGNGRDRYVAPLRTDACREHKDGETTYWIWTRNDVLKTLNLEQNPISDVEAVEAIQPFGTGSLVLRSTPCAPALLQKRKESGHAESAEPEEGSSGVLNGGAEGWKLILQ